jgi:hypothetical protein
MIRALPVCAVLLALPLSGRPDGQAATTETVVRMKVSPARAPKPALRYLLLPEVREMNPGNPILGYLKCFSEQQFFFSKEEEEKREKWLGMPLKDLPAEELRDYGGQVVRQAHDAARLDTPDWQILLKLKSEGLRTLLPDVQQVRSLAAALHVRFRGEVAGRRFEDAVDTAKTMFTLSRHLGEHPTLIGELVGMAVASMAVNTLEEMIQQPGCPNLYWALTELPNPLINLHRGLSSQRLLLAAESTGLDETAPMTEAQLRTTLGRAVEFAEAAVGPGGPPKVGETVREWLAGRAKDEAHVRAARRRLVEFGLAENRVKQFPALQVVLLDERIANEVRRDEATRGLTLPYWQTEGLFTAARAPKEGELPLGWGPLAYDKIRQTKARLEQRIALLRCVEALRIYAAEHDGKLPTRLDEVKVPLPLDPVTGKAVIYRLKGGNTATVRGTPPRGLEKDASFNVRIEVTVAK